MAGAIMSDAQTVRTNVEMTRSILLFLAGMLFGATAIAQTPTKATVVIKCQSGTPQGELACLTPDLKELEVAVERQLYQLGIKMRTSERTKRSAAARELKSSQGPWLQYRNQFCIIEALASTDQSEWLKVRTTECKMRLTKDRLESLRDLEATLE